jgi:hypothetical protein
LHPFERPRHPLIMKKSFATPHGPAAAILAGGLMFSAPASAAIVFNEDFEGETNAFGMPTYAYALNYTLPNALDPAGATKYGHGGPGTNGSASTLVFGPLAASIVTLSLTPSIIDLGLGTYDFYAQFSTYREQNDFALLTLIFKDDFDTSLGTPVILGGSELVTALPTVGLERGWGEQTMTGSIPVGARSVTIQMDQTKTPGGTNTDGYVDNIVLDVNVVPEPGTAALLLLGAAGCLRRRRPMP